MFGHSDDHDGECLVKRAHKPHKIEVQYAPVVWLCTGGRRCVNLKGFSVQQCSKAAAVLPGGPVPPVTKPLPTEEEEFKLRRLSLETEPWRRPEAVDLLLHHPPHSDPAQRTLCPGATVVESPTGVFMQDCEAVSVFLARSDTDEAATKDFVNGHGFHFWIGRYQHTTKCDGRGTEAAAKGEKKPAKKKADPEEKKGNSKPNPKSRSTAKPSGKPPPPPPAAAPKRPANPAEEASAAKRQTTLQPDPSPRRVEPALKMNVVNPPVEQKTQIAALPGAWASGFYQ